MITMFGILRTTLAVMVMVFHLFSQVGPLGTYSVFGFYMISGYLMTTIMHDSYGFTWHGRYSFAVNRFLRLYPQYWGAMLISFLLIAILGVDAAKAYHSSLFIPVSIIKWLENLLMIYPSWNPAALDPRFIPPTWALTVEIFFYTLIGIGISKSFKRVKVWLILSVCYVVASYLLGLPFKDRYFPVAAASLPFSIGSAIYFLSRRQNTYVALLNMRLSSLTLFVLMLLNCIVWIVLVALNVGNIAELGFYMNIVIFSLLIYNIARGSEIFSIAKNVDKFVGDFSYPIYLLHWQSGLLVSYIIFGNPFHEVSVRGFISLMAALVLVVVVSYIFTIIIDTPIQRIRSRIKARTNGNLAKRIAEKEEFHHS